MRIKAHPTTYSGIVFRSRLEATWAAFFDLCGWRWMYEPFDLEGWSPDFALGHDLKVLCEVKPATIQYQTKLPSEFDKVIPHGGLCLGLGPYHHGWSDTCFIGAFTNMADQGDAMIIGKPGQADLAKFMLGRADGSVGLIEGEPSRDYFFFMPLWKQAQNETQWRKPQ